MKLLPVLLCFDLMVCSWCARILVHVPTPTHSHNIVYQPIIKELARRGHQVVSITTFPLNDEDRSENITEIDISFSKLRWKEIFDKGTPNMGFRENHKLYIDIMYMFTVMQMNYPEVKKLNEDVNEHFDLVIVEWLYYFSTYGWSYRFNCPLIGLTSMDVMTDGHDYLGNPSHPYLSPIAIYDFIVGPDMTMWERFKSITYYIILRYDLYRSGYHKHNDFMKTYFGEDAPQFADIANNVSLVIANQNTIFNSQPRVPIVLYVEMLHVKESKPLPEDLQSFLDAADEGVIYLSMGSNVKSSSLPKEKLDIFLEVFANIPYKVLWKWETKQLPARLGNLHVCQWCPQQDILEHKNVKLFMMQGGLQSVEEAIHHRVPILGMPMIIDQKQNILKLMKWGAAEMVQFNEISASKLTDLIIKMMFETSYSSNMARLASLIEDQPQKALDRAVWWIEYVLRHNGTEHMRPPRIPWYLYFVLDFVAVVLIAFALFACVSYKSYCLTKKLYCLYCNRTKIKMR